MIKNILFFLTIFTTTFTIQSQEDPYLWLENVDSEKSLEFVNKQNKLTHDKLSGIDEYKDIYDSSLEIYNSTDRIAYPSTYGEFVYNFWKDKDHVRGIWRRSEKANYLEGNPTWETLLDLDEMSFFFFFFGFIKAPVVYIQIIIDLLLTFQKVVVTLLLKKNLMLIQKNL